MRGCAPVFTFLILPHASHAYIPHFTSALTRVSEFDIITSQMHRFRVICSRYSDFCEEMARLLAAMQQRGYPRRQLRKKLECTLPLWPDLYFKQRGSKIRHDNIAANIYGIFEAMHS